MRPSSEILQGNEGVIRTAGGDFAMMLLRAPQRGWPMCPGRRSRRQRVRNGPPSRGPDALARFETGGLQALSHVKE